MREGVQDQGNELGSRMGMGMGEWRTARNGEKEKIDDRGSTQEGGGGGGGR